MKPLTREWVNKAEGDYATAARARRAIARSGIQRFDEFFD